MKLGRAIIIADRIRTGSRRTNVTFDQRLIHPASEIQTLFVLFSPSKHTLFFKAYCVTAMVTYLYVR